MNYPRHSADPTPETVQCIICDTVAKRVPWSVNPEILLAPDDWGNVTGLPGLRCGKCMQSLKANTTPNATS